ncbi:unnamed protein product, partial [Allacma fusca]
MLKSTQVNLSLVLEFQRESNEIKGTEWKSKQRNETAQLLWKPPPKVTWWRGGSLLDDTYRPITGDGTVNNRLDIPRLTRSDLHDVFT